MTSIYPYPCAPACLQSALVYLSQPAWSLLLSICLCLWMQTTHIYSILPLSVCVYPRLSALLACCRRASICPCLPSVYLFLNCPFLHDVYPRKSAPVRLQSTHIYVPLSACSLALSICPSLPGVYSCLSASAYRCRLPTSTVFCPCLSASTRVYLPLSAFSLPLSICPCLHDVYPGNLRLYDFNLPMSMRPCLPLSALVYPSQPAWSLLLSTCL
jgi:hypothetical protein